MAFNTGLSGLRAASVDLDVTGNNIANASTVGFKSSKTQFGDLYASGFLSAGTNPIGDGVRVQDVTQSFGQGNISFTDNGLDMAISGDGFFILNNGGEIRYSRAGQFSIDKEGYVTNNQSMRVQGYTADEDGNLSGIRGDLQIETDNLAPRRTTNLDSDLNLDSREAVLESRVTQFGGVSVEDLIANGGDEFIISYADGSPNQQITIPATVSDDGGSSTRDITAREIADQLNGIDGVSSSATTNFVFEDDGGGVSSLEAVLADPDFAFELEIDGQSIFSTSGATTKQGLIDAINSSNASSVSAFLIDSEDGSGNPIEDIRIIDNRGSDLTVSYGTTGSLTGYDKVGNLEVFADRSIQDITTTDPNDPAITSLVASGYDTGELSITNAFNPLDQRTYNHATSTSIYDSLGNSHELTQFFVKNPSPGDGVGVSEWSVYVQIDGESVGGTDVSPYTARFDQDGVLQSIDGDANGEVLIADWIPKDVDGQPNGADGPPADGEDVVTPIPDPPTTSAFVINLSGTTQYGAEFGVNDQQQNGYTTGRLSGLDVSDQGVLFARYTNGQSQSLGQVALASFNNTNGLSPVGDTSWVETFESGQPIIGAPDTGTLGSIKASSVEESNVDLSAELVNLIIAQRNYQANAKTIETSDAVTQTIINLR
ncbi:flagellar hook protein FlgE [Marinobacter sp. F3R08]|uniref:flagellar hook protein FlgE n=1 Tax=Marinobacter sp. F3R08 TaxID=2841559 RepID=UPI001C085729|nr:flagellar hook protein FlgE [Marinobacter sp. F3R08]MBU2952578.1 flagellar hook protein FlgE [Marinobacter sp. F3R08]